MYGQYAVAFGDGTSAYGGYSVPWHIFGDKNRELHNVTIAYYIRNGFSSDEMYLNKKHFQFTP
jgi:hypothetical protein